jgi:hypothetical protein
MALAPTDRWRAYNTPAEHYSNPVKVPESTGPNAISRSGFFGYPCRAGQFRLAAHRVDPGWSHAPGHPPALGMVSALGAARSIEHECAAESAHGATAQNGKASPTARKIPRRIAIYEAVALVRTTRHRRHRGD